MVIGMDKILIYIILIYIIGYYNLNYFVFLEIYI